ncbi:MAG TPA: prepilin-type N-terminal cleavage/methylation domain-containing protein [Candidatus Sulfotelmatobacter sp.]|nr:prepilin-type N-terminal cleavage/methylation domain-containing protein [Candidatus Sulfotelmatobacter sp.]
MLKRYLRKERGDTIIEVLVVLTILGLAMSISYATANQSLDDTRQAQDAAQAAQIVQSQLESLRTMVTNPATVNGNPNPNYIFNPNYTMANSVCVTPDAVTPGTFDISSNSGASSSTNPCYLYNQFIVSISYTQSSGVIGGQFEIQASWYGTNGSGTNTSTLFYNLYQP